MHGIKSTDNGFNGFGEVYFSTVDLGAIKAWKLHKKMTLNLFVPIGKVLFIFLDKREDSETYLKNYKVILSPHPYFRLTVPPGIWFGFKGLDAGINLITNVANVAHDPSEILRKEIDEIDMDWSIE